MLALTVELTHFAQTLHVQIKSDCSPWTSHRHLASACDLSPRHVLGLTAVLADGEVVRTGRRVRKSSAGYDLTHLLVCAWSSLPVVPE